MTAPELKLFVYPKQLELFGGVAGIRRVLGTGFEIWLQSVKVGEAPKLLSKIGESE